MDDNAIMSLVTSGEVSAMAMLYEKYKMPLYAYFQKVTLGDSHASEDLVQTVFYRAIRYKSTFSGQGSFVKWIFSIAHNTSIDYRKKVKNIIKYTADATPEMMIVHDDQDEKDEKNEKLELLQQAMGKLNAEERELVTLCKIECLRYADVGEILGISESNVKVRMFRAMQKLREIFMNLERRRYEKTGS